METTPQTLTRDEIENILGKLAEKKQEHTQLCARLARAQARIARTIEARIQTAANEIKDAEETIRKWAEDNRAKFFADGKTLQLLHGTLRFRAGGFKVQFLKDWTDKLCIQTLKRFRKLKESYIRIKEELNKQQIVNDFSAGKIDSKTLAKFGCEVKQGEYFSIELPSNA